MMDENTKLSIQFAYRFDFDDGEYLKTNGYSNAQIDIKLRILKARIEKNVFLFEQLYLEFT